MLVRFSALASLLVIISIATACGDDSDSGSNGNGNPAGGASGSGATGATAGSGGTGGSSGDAGSTGGTGGAGGAGGSIGGTGGSSGAPIDAGPEDAASDSELDGEAGCATPTCSGLSGPSMVEVPVSGGCPFCIDSTEVTNAQYATFLTAKGSDTSGQPTKCTWNTSFTPSSGWPAAGKDDFPVTFIDWCDARAYCAWAGKRLCGKIAGASNAVDDFVDASQSQWYTACSKGGTQSMPYGTFYVPANCNGYASGAGAPIAVTSATNCVGGYPGIHDMSGNVAEWEDSCQDDAPTAFCRLRGGHWNSTGGDLDCAVNSTDSRNDSGPNVGFRCCAG